MTKLRSRCQHNRMLNEEVSVFVFFAVCTNTKAVQRGVWCGGESIDVNSRKEKEGLDLVRKERKKEIKR